MDIVIKVVTLIGSIATVVGLVWVLTSTIDYFQARKNRDKSKQDEALEGILYGGILSVVASGIVAAITTQLGGITF